MIKQREVEEINSERMSRWHFSRGEFIKSLALIGLSSQFIACSTTETNESEQDDKRITPLMSNQQAQIIQIVQNILFPNDGNGPGVEEINAFPYLLWYLQDDLIKEYQRQFILEGADKLESETQNIFKSSFLELNPEFQNKTITLLAKKKRTKLWLSKLLTLIFEALLTDPSYGGNKNKIGWEWLNHNPGFPRSNQKNQYPEIIKTVRDEV